MAEKTTEKLITIRWPLSSLSSYHFLVLPPFVSPSLSLDPLDDSLSLQHCVAYTFYKIALLKDVLFAVRAKEHYIFARVIIGTTHIHNVAMQLSLVLLFKKARRSLTHTSEEANTLSYLACK
jgi:hypothetical protein